MLRADDDSAVPSLLALLLLYVLVIVKNKHEAFRSALLV